MEQVGSFSNLVELRNLIIGNDYIYFYPFYFFLNKQVQMTKTKKTIGRIIHIIRTAKKLVCIID